MKLFIATIGWERHSIEQRDLILALAREDTAGRHLVSEDPDSADAVLFVDLHQQPQDLYLRGLRQHPLVRAHPDKIFVLDERDRPFFTHPGIYVSGDASDPRVRSMRGGPDSRFPNAPATAQNEPDLLFSFLGSRTHPIREAILALEHPGAEIADTSAEDFLPWRPGADPAQRAAGQARYAEILARSRFVLCPRGHGPSSFRLYETLSAGRVPVIISDAWLAPAGVDWEHCSLRVAEADAARLPEIIERRAADWPTLAAGARTVWAEHFAETARWNYYGDRLAELVGAPGTRAPWWAQRQVARLTAARLRDAGRRRFAAVRGG